MGWNSQDIFNILIVEGAAGGVFIYDSSGNLVASIALQANVDPLTHSNQPGITTYSPGLNFAQLNSGSVVLGSLNGATRITSKPAIALDDALLDTTQPAIATSSPGASPGTVFTANLFGESKDLSEPAGFGLNTGAGIRPGNAWFVKGPSLGGGDDGAQLNALFTAGYRRILLLPGTYSIGTTVNVPGNGELSGSPGTIFQATAALAGGMIGIAGISSRVEGVHFKDNGFSADCIQVAAGANRWTVRDIIAENVKGLVVNIPGSTGAMHGVISGVLATGCNGGIDAEFGSGSSTLELSIAQVNIQSCQSAPVLKINSVTDVTVSDLNGSVATGSGVPAVQVIGDAQAVSMTGIDVGGDSTAGGTTPVLDIGSTGAVSEIAISDSVFQSGGNGIVVAGSASRCRFSSVMSKHNQFDGWKWTGTGAFNQMIGCAGNTNNQAAGTGYDIDCTSTAHVLIYGFAYVSTGVTANINLTQVTNHVTETDPSGGRTAAGNPPSGW